MIAIEGLGHIQANERDGMSANEMSSAANRQKKLKLACQLIFAELNVSLVFFFHISFASSQ